MTGAFWIGGAKAYREGLRKEHAETMAELQSRLNSCDDDSKRAECEAAISQAKATYKSRLKEVSKGIF